jgi:glycosyltransferase involved in cell wall biosynthesis
MQCDIPRVSVIIPTFNRKAYVQEAIDSVLAQTYTDYEIIVVDDGSTDGTSEALRARFGDRVQYLWQENQGESVARNRGVEIARGEYIGLLDSDDLYLPGKLEIQVPLLGQDAGVGQVFGRSWLIDQDGRRLRPGARSRGDRATSFDKSDFYFSNPVGGPSRTLLRKAVLDRVGGFDPAIGFGEDRDLWLRIARETRLLAHADIVACIRRHPGRQAQHLDPETNSRRLADHARMLEKAFTMDNPPEEIRRAALAVLYAKAAIWEEAIGNHEGAARNLQRAREYQARFVVDPQGLGQLITRHVTGVAYTGGVPNFEGAQQALRSILGRWRALSEVDARFESAVSAQAYAAFSSIASQAHDFERARRYAFRAIRCDRRWLRDGRLVKDLLGGTLPPFLRRAS